MNEKIANIIKTKIQSLSFVDKIAGLTRPVMVDVLGEGNTKVQKIYPIACNVSTDDCIKGRYQDLIPNSKYASIIYFEDLGTTFTKEAQNWMKFDSRLSLVCWMNLKKLGECEKCTTSTEVLLSILGILSEFPFNDSTYAPIREIKIESIGEAVKSNNIFSKYTYDEKTTQYLLYPYDFFMLNMSVSYRINLHCIDEFLKQPACIC